MKILVLALFIFSACTTAQFAPSKLNDPHAVRTQPNAIELFRSSQPPKKYVEIGAVNACCSIDPNAMIELLRQKASENGGDALIDLEINAKGGAAATVIRYND